MRRFLKFSMAAILALGFWSCVSEEPMEDPSGDATALQFTIKQPVTAFVTRADIATSNEWNIATMDVYAVEDGGTADVAKLTENTDYTMAQDAATHTFTITMSDPWLKTNGSKTMNFYFVGNDKTSNSGGDGHAGLTGTKKEAAFKDALTDNLTAVKVAKPNGTTQNLLFSTMVQVPNITGTVKYSGMLKRREARFDIEVNEAFVNDFELTKVEIGGTYQNGMIFGVGDATKVTSGSKNTTTIPNTDLAYNAKVNGAAVNNAVQSAFYTYPLSLNESNLSAGDRSYITIFGKLNGEERAYPVTVPENTPIQANFRYILRMDNPSVDEDDLFGSVSLVAVDYEEGEIFGAEPGAGNNPAKADIQLIPSENALRAGVFRNNTISLTPGFERMSIEIFTESQYGVILNVTESRPGSIQVNNVGTTFSRGINARSSFEITIPKGTTEFEAYVDIISTTDPKDNERIKIYRASAPRIEAPYILYMDDKSGALSAGKWDNNKVRTDNMAYFKFGSVIGFNNSEAKWPADGSAIMFNPSAKKWATDMTAYAPDSYNAATSNALPNIPGYVSGDYPKNVTVESGYITVANVRAGKGDPCMLVGYTAKQIQDMTDSELQNVLANAKLRLPTRMENRTFAGSTSNWASRWSAGTPGMGTFGSYKLPALGRSGSGNGVLVDPNTSGDYWSSEVRDAVKSFYLDFTNSGLHPEYDQNYSNGATIRCVENEKKYKVETWDQGGTPHGKISINGTMVDAGDYIYLPAGTYTISAVPDEGYMFGGDWTYMGNATIPNTKAATTEVTIGGNCRLNVEFKLQGAKILYWEKPQSYSGYVLRLGEWGDGKVTKDNIAYFKFGSIMLMSNKEPFIDTEIGDPDDEALLWGFTNNDTPLNITTYNPTPWSADTQNTGSGVPGYTKADYPKNVTVADGYVTVANIKKGKGDPCMFVDQNYYDFRSFSDAELQALIDNAKYRLPTKEENMAFIGSTSSWSSRWSAGTPGIGTFGFYKLPAVGCRNDSGSMYAQNTNGYCWSSTPYTNNNGYIVAFRENTLGADGFHNYSMGNPVRCVPNVY